MSLKDIFLGVLIAAIWGCNFIFIKLGTEEVPPLFLCALRFFLAAIPAVFFIPFPTQSNFKMLALYGLVMFGLQFTLIFTSIAVGMTAGMASLLIQTQIFFSIGFAVIFLEEVPSLWQILGALVAFSGILLVALHLSDGITLKGFILIISGAASWGVGNLITKQIKQVNIAALIVWGSLIACPPLLLLSLMIEGPHEVISHLQTISLLGIISVMYLVYISTWIGYGLWNFLLSRYPVTTIAPYTLLVPVFGMLSAFLVLGENLDVWKIAASSLVMLGLLINLFGAKFLTRKKIVG